MKRLHNNYGFTLFEILIATGLFGLAIVVVLNGVLFANELKVRDNTMLQAAFLANQKMVELEMTIEDEASEGLFPDEKSESGTFDKPYDRFSWNYQIKKIEIPMQEGDQKNVVALMAMKKVFEELSKSVREVSLTVSWFEDDEDEEPKTVVLTTHIVDIK